MTAATGMNLPLGVSLHMLDPDQRVDTIELLRGSSVRAIELFEDSFEKSDSHVRKARQALASTGVEPRTIHADFGPELDISSPDAPTRSAGIHKIGAAIDLAARIGAAIVVIHSSSEPIISAERGAKLAHARNSIGSVAQLARDAGCRLAVELLPRTCLGNSADELLYLLEALDPSAVGVCLDVNHLMDRFASLPDVVHRLGSRLLALHISDYDGIDEKHWLPMRGVIDWVAFLSALSRRGFAGPLNYEAHLNGQTPGERLASLEANYAQLIALAQ